MRMTMTHQAADGKVSRVLARTRGKRALDVSRPYMRVWKYRRRCGRDSRLLYLTLLQLTMKPVLGWDSSGTGLKLPSTLHSTSSILRVHLSQKKHPLMCSLNEIARLG